jgi:hypothetical protein
MENPIDLANRENAGSPGKEPADNRSPAPFTINTNVQKVLSVELKSSFTDCPAAVFPNPCFRIVDFASALKQEILIMTR